MYSINFIEDAWVEPDCYEDLSLTPVLLAIWKEMDEGVKASNLTIVHGVISSSYDDDF